ncbi:Concanavalin A-like lectin/glucanases superfamily [Penicillium atrosanguineum]|nr:Concanavalin A-like lectin/glucanases superfamily [Penicillium atrosanguineum]
MCRRCIKRLGYGYVDLQPWQEKYNTDGSFSSESYLGDLRERINDLYGVSRKELQKATNLKGVKYDADALKTLEYSFSIRFAKYVFGGEPFWIRVYIARDGSKQNATTDLIAEVYNFSQTPDDAAGKVACRNCKTNQQENLKVSANLSITPILINIINSGAKELLSLSRDDVLKYLQKKVYWRVFQFGKEVPSYALGPLELEVIGATNDATHFNDPKKAPLVENFKKEPTLTGGADGALDPVLKQPQTLPPSPPKTESHQANLVVGKHLQFKKPLTPDSVIIIDSACLNLTPARANGIDNSQLYLTSGPDGKGDILFLLSIRRAENAIVFNTLVENSWGKEERVPLDSRFRTDTPSLLIHDQGSGYEVFIDYCHVYWFEKRAKDKVAKATVSLTL